MDEKTVDKRVLCRAPVAEVFEALLDEASVAEWMTADVDIDPVVGGRIFIGIAGWPDVLGHIVDLESPHFLKVHWQASDWVGPSELTVNVSESSDGCWVVIQEKGFAQDSEVFAQRDALWSHWLIRLAAVVSRR